MLKRNAADKVMDQIEKACVLKILTAMANRITPKTLRKTAKPDLPTTRSNHGEARKTM